MRQPEFWTRNDPASQLMAALLSPLGFVYGASIAWKKQTLKPYRSRAAVICVGNLTIGGSGKTPIAIAIAQMLQQKGIRVTFLTRGYGRRSSGAIQVNPELHDAAAVGDEALLLARTASTIVSADRAEGARLAEQQGVDVIVMDDGYQNFSLAKDVSLVVVDGDSGFGNGRIIPAGPLRENVQRGLERADAIVLTGNGSPPLPDFARPILRAHLTSDRHFDESARIAFAGIGRPDKFFATLRAQGAHLAGTHSFADHHAYSAADIAMLRATADKAGAILITTEKDFVRLGANDRAGIDTLSVCAVFDDPAALDRVLTPITMQKTIS
ncbi:MAG TPA: tetraacyldisaccharide 4'-kinase [Rhizomicrobium sp.]|jgi:tetraacyldisaccharide 4'-kinase